jgi:hypothetical protein
MKTETSLRKSAEQSLKRAATEADNVKRDIARLKDGEKLEKVMPRLRLQVLELEKNIHEFSAYRNALDTK